MKVVIEWALVMVAIVAFLALGAEEVPGMEVPFYVFLEQKLYCFLLLAVSVLAIVWMNKRSRSNK